MNRDRYVIMVEDDPTVLHSLRLQMREILPSHYHIETANDGEEALELLNEINDAGGLIPVVITDHQMPRMSGSEFLLRLKQLVPKCRNIMLTGEAGLSDVTKLVNEQALYRYISKPWVQSDLEITVLSALESFNQEYKLEKLNRKLLWINENLEEQVRERTLRLQQKNIEIQNGLEFANLMQRNLLPRSEDIRSFFSHTEILFRPHTQVSGDFYFFHQATEHKAMVVIGDATGHGVAGAFLSNICLAILNNIVENKVLEAPQEVLTEVLQRFKRLSANASSTMRQLVSVELTVACFDKSEWNLSYATNSKQLYLSKNNYPVIIDEERFQCCLGNSESARNLKHRGRTGGCSLSLVDTVLFYTDGVPDQFVAVNGKKMGRTKLYGSLEAISQQGAQAWFHALQGNEPNVDDATLVLIRP